MALGSGSGGSSCHRVHVIEHPVTYQASNHMPGAPGDSPGDQLPFANPIFNADNTKQVGSDEGNWCARQHHPRECMWMHFSAQQITVEGAVRDQFATTVLAITGGTGAYRNARGTDDPGPRARTGFRLHLPSAAVTGPRGRGWGEEQPPPVP